MNIVKSIIIAIAFLLSAASSARVHKGYVGVDVGVTHAFPANETSFYEEVRVGYQYKNSLLGVSYNKSPHHFWDFLESSPTGYVPTDVFFNANTFGVFYRHSCSSYTKTFAQRVAVTPHAEVAVKKHDSGMPDYGSGFQFNGFVGASAKVAKYFFVNADVGGSYFFTENAKNSRTYSAVAKFGLGFVF